MWQELRHREMDAANEREEEEHDRSACLFSVRTSPRPRAMAFVLQLRLMLAFVLDSQRPRFAAVSMSHSSCPSSEALMTDTWEGGN